LILLNVAKKQHFCGATSKVVDIFRKTCIIDLVMMMKEEKMTEKTVLQLTQELCTILKSNYYLRDSKLDYDYVIEAGRKYFKIVMVNNQRSVHAFVDKKTGDLYKAAGWAQPAKGIRFNLISDIERLREIGKTQTGMWAGGYLYR
jgi:hypothetical protein